MKLLTAQESTKMETTQVQERWHEPLCPLQERPTASGQQSHTLSLSITVLYSSLMEVAACFQFTRRSLPGHLLPHHQARLAHAAELAFGRHGAVQDMSYYNPPSWDLVSKLDK